MRSVAAFYWLCVKEAWRGSFSLANAWSGLWGPLLLWAIAASRGYTVTLPDKLDLAALTLVFAFLGATWVALFLVRLLIAPAALFLAEKTAADALRQEIATKHAPAFIIKIEQSVMGMVEGGTSTCVLGVSIRNIGTPSIADNYRIFMINNGKEYICQLRTMLTPALVLQNANPAIPPVSISPSDIISEKTITPIPTGGQVRGWLVSIIPGLPNSEINRSTLVIRTEVEDVVGVNYSALFEYRGKPPDLPAYYPDGTGGRMFQQVAGYTFAGTPPVSGVAINPPAASPPSPAPPR